MLRPDPHDYDSLGRITSANNPLGSFSYSYVGATPRVSSVAYPNGQSTTFSYYGTTGDLRLQQISHLSATNSTLSQFSYEYDVAGQITKWTRQVDTETPTAYQFGYDAANQLISAVLKNPSTSAILKQYGYTYDPVGNRTSEQVDNTVNSATHNNLNQVLSRQGGGKMRFSGTLSELGTVTVGGNPGTVTQAVSGTTTNVIFQGLADVTVGTNVVSVVAKGGGGIARTNRYQVVVSSGITQTLTYDPSGNLVSRSGGGSSTTYEWDVVNRLKAITSGTHRTEFTYDGLNRRVRIVEKENGTVASDKRLVWDGMQIAEERDSAGTTVTKRYYPQGVSVFNPSSSVYNSFYYARDHLGSIREVTDSTGTKQARYDYDPYGRRTKVSGDFDADFGFTGYYYHAPSGLHLALYRAYDADVGRWLSRDPLGELRGDSAALYQYTLNNPIIYTDPYGLILEVWGGNPLFVAAVQADIRNLMSKPYGKALIEALRNSKHYHLIIPTKCFNHGVGQNGSTPLNETASSNGKGTGSIIEYNYSNYIGLAPDKNKSYWRPPYVALGHELGHSLDYDQGSACYDWGDGRPHSTPPREKRSMEAENAIRNEHGITERDGYYPP